MTSSRSHSNSEAEPGGHVRSDPQAGVPSRYFMAITSKLLCGAPSRYQALCLVTWEVQRAFRHHSSLVYLTITYYTSIIEAAWHGGQGRGPPQSGHKCQLRHLPLMGEGRLPNLSVPKFSRMK